jgi:hypothetical protein
MDVDITELRWNGMLYFVAGVTRDAVANVISLKDALIASYMLAAGLTWHRSINDIRSCTPALRKIR